MSYFKVQLPCPKCQKEMVAFDVAIGPEWELALNVRCACGFEGGTTFDLCELVTVSRERSGLVLQ